MTAQEQSLSTRTTEGSTIEPCGTPVLMGCNIPVSMACGGPKMSRARGQTFIVEWESVVFGSWRRKEEFQESLSWNILF